MVGQREENGLYVVTWVNIFNIHNIYQNLFEVSISRTLAIGTLSMSSEY